MRLVSITPKNQWELMFKQPIAMGLTHLVQKYPDTYAEIARNRDKDCYLMLDNSIVELGESVTLKEILEAADKVQANEVILRDSYPNGPRTIERIKEDIQYLRDNNLTNKYKIMAVCHGENIEDFKATFEYINSVPEITCIGIPKVLSKWCGERKSLSDIWLNTEKEIHLLGSWNSLEELINLPYNMRLKIRSCDTCLPALNVIQNKGVFDVREGTIDLEKDYPELTKEGHDKMMDTFYKEYNNTLKQ